MSGKKEEKDSYRHLFDAISNPIIEVNEELVITLANREAIQKWSAIVEGKSLSYEILLCTKEKPENFVIEETFKSKKPRFVESVSTRGETLLMKTNYYEKQDNRKVIVHIQDVSTQREAEEALLASVKRNQAFVQAIPDLMFTLTRDGTYLDFKADREEDLAIPANQVIGKNIRETGFSGEYIEVIFYRIEQALATGEVQTFEYELKTPKGLGIYECRLAALNENEILAVVRDITQRKRVENLTTAQKDLAQALSTTISLEEAMALCVQKAIEVSGMDSGGAYLLDRSDGALSLVYSYGLPPAFVESAAYYAADTPNTRLVMQGKPFYSDYAHFFPDTKDEVRKREGLRFLAVVPVLHEGEVIACLNIASHSREDIPLVERDALEAIAAQMGGAIAHLQAEAALKKSEENYRTLQANIPVGIFHSTWEGRLVSVNPAMVKMFGYDTEEELLAVSTVDLYVHPEQRQELLALLKDKGVGTGFEVELKRKDGSTFWCAINLKGITDKRGNITHQVGILKDITKRKRSEEDRQKVEEEHLKREKLESLGLLAGGIAHDFNNILASVIANITLARMNIKREQKVLTRLNDAEKALARAKDLTRQLLTFSKGGAPIKSPASVDGLLRDTVNFALSGSNVKCDWGITEPLWDVEIDEGQVSQVIQNLIINAEQAMPEGGVVQVLVENVHIEEREELPLKEGRYVKIAIKDQGVGIAPNHLDKIFDPFFTTKQRGSGLGLSTAYSVIKNHKGLITVESELGLGSTFYLFLPACAERKETKEIHMSEMTEAQGKILIMDDEDIILEATGELLQEVGYAVARAKDGAEAIKLYEEARQSGQPFDAVIMDLIVPGGMGGQQALGELLKRDPHARVVASSGYSTDPIMANYQEYGFVGALCKPYKLMELYTVIDQAISGQKK